MITQAEQDKLRSALSIWFEVFDDMDADGLYDLLATAKRIQNPNENADDIHWLLNVNTRMNYIMPKEVQPIMSEIGAREEKKLLKMIKDFNY